MQPAGRWMMAGAAVVGLGAACTSSAPLVQSAAATRGESAAPRADEEADRRDDVDPYRWLEELRSERALAWIYDQVGATRRRLDDHPLFRPLNVQIRESLATKFELATPSHRGDYVYTRERHLRDGTPIRGVWRRATVESYRSGRPSWEDLLDLDELVAEENEDWFWRGAQCRRPDADRCMISLSIGGSDAVVHREFDVERRSFVEDHAFELPASRSEVSWWNADTLLVASALTDDDDLASSGHARKLVLWKRGDDIRNARLLFEGDIDDVRVTGARWGDEALVMRMTDAFSRRYYLQGDGEPQELHLPEGADLVGYLADDALMILRSGWSRGEREIGPGSLAAASFDELRGGDVDLEPVIEPGARASIEGVTPMGRAAIVHVLEGATSRLWRVAPTAKGIEKTPLSAPVEGTIDIVSVDAESGLIFYTYESFLEPPTIYQADVVRDRHEPVAQADATFDAEGMQVTCHEATSSDGTRVPYFLVAPAAAGDHSRPALLTAYGGFGVAKTPTYLYRDGPAWLERGGIYVLANIRGGGEFGPAWHDAARGRHRQRAFDDFIAVAEDLIERGITSSDRLGIIGGSNGGLLVGAAFTQRPELFGAAVARVPIFDMRRYHELHSGAGYVAEFGNPDDPEVWSYLRAYSPYHNVDAEADYPPLFVVTAINDDRVHPAHARKMTARMQAYGHDVLYYETERGGHAGPELDGAIYTFLNAALNPDVQGLPPPR